MAAPTTTDLTNFLTTIGVTASGSADLSALLNSATLEFETRTGRQKYQGDTGVTAVRYTIPALQGNSVRLTIADCWAITEVRTNYSGAGTGVVLTEYTDYIHRPDGHTQKKQPIEAIQFVYMPSIEPGSILITGKLGYASDMPADVFQAILSRAASQLLIQQAGESATVAEEKQGDRSVKYGSEAGRGTIDRLQKVFDLTASRYTKVAY
jgi:hypothetical protein